MENITRRDFIKMTGMIVPAAAIRVPDFPQNGLEVNRHYSDVLNNSTQEALALKASSLLHPTPSGAIDLANWLRNTIYSSADNICGPLSIYQQMDTTTLGIRLEDFWLANARLRNNLQNSDVFSRAFPSDRFNSFGSSAPLSGIDFNSVGLQPGDFLYFMGANGHGFDHMMSISRRDKSGTYWAVTNYPDQNGNFVVIEVPFWIPDDPEKSFVKDLAKGKNSIGFSSGQGGFVLWRLKEDKPSAFDLLEHSVAADTLRSDIENMARGSLADWGIIVANLESGKIIAENSSNIRKQTADLMRVPLAMCVMSVLESKVSNQSDLIYYLNKTTFKGMTFSQSLTRMIANSDKREMTRMSQFLTEEYVNSQALLATWGINDTYPSYLSTTGRDLWSLFGSLYNVDNSTILRYPYSHVFLLNLLSLGGGDAKNLTEIGANGVPALKIYEDSGLTSTRDYSLIAKAGILQVPSNSLFFPSTNSYFISINGQGGTDKISYEALKNEFSGILAMVAKYLKG